MKKLFNYFALLMMCLTVSVAFVSCGDDEDEPKGSNLEEQLQGTWNFQVMKISVMGQTIEMDIDDLKNNTGYNQFYDDVLKFSGSKVNGGTYKINGNKILLPWYESVDWWASVSFSGSKMTLYYDINYEGVPMKMWITYIKSGSRSLFNERNGHMPAIIDEVLKGGIIR